MGGTATGHYFCAVPDWLANNLVPQTSLAFVFSFALGPESAHQTILYPFIVRCVAVYGKIYYYKW